MSLSFINNLYTIYRLVKLRMLKKRGKERALEPKAPGGIYTDVEHSTL